MKFAQLLILSMALLTIHTQVTAQVKVYDDFDAFHKEILEPRSEEGVHIINFWATWCKPCVQELPYFEEVSATAAYKVLLVSLDFSDNIGTKLLPFIEKRQLRSEVVALTDTKYNDWIDSLSPEWSGAIPATLFIKNGKRLFKEKSYQSMEEILSDLNSF